MLTKLRAIFMVLFSTEFIVIIRHKTGAIERESNMDNLHQLDTAITLDQELSADIENRYEVFIQSADPAIINDLRKVLTSEIDPQLN